MSLTIGFAKNLTKDLIKET